MRAKNKIFITMWMSLLLPLQALSQEGYNITPPSYFTPPSITDAQKRKVHLPYIRAATNCLADSVRNDPNLLNAVQKNQLIGLVSNKMGICGDAVAKMIAEHDRLYGIGTGVAFYQGAYLNDLSRALLTRLQPDIHRLTIQQSQLEEQNKQRVEVADKTAELLKTRMYECTGIEVSKLVKSAENAEVLTTAAMTICNREIEQTLISIVDVLKLKTSLSYDDEMKFRNGLKDIFRKNILTQSVQIKAISASSPPNTNVNVSAQNNAQNTNLQTDLEMNEITKCLQSVSEVRNGKLVDRENLLKIMIDLCRTEIESTARNAFIKIKEPKIDSLSNERERVINNTIKEANSILGVTPK